MRRTSVSAHPPAIISGVATDLYISLDIEADGPIPGPTGWGYSMLSLGACVAGTLNDDGFRPIDPTADTFYVELKPISDDVVPEALAICERALSMPRDELLTQGAEPTRAMREFVDWVKAAERKHDARAVRCPGHDVFPFFQRVRPVVTDIGGRAAPVCDLRHTFALLGTPFDRNHKHVQRDPP